MKFIVIEGDNTSRADVYLKSKFPSLSRSYIKKLFDNKEVTLNNTVIKASTSLKIGQQLKLLNDPSELPIIPDIQVPIIYEDKDCLFIDKPIGLLSHSKGAFNPEATVATFISQFWQDPETNDRNGIVHRLDRATSGVMIAAKNEKALMDLQKQFNQRKVQKTYYAIIGGHLKEQEAIIDMPIARNPKNPKTFHVSTTGKPSQTHYKVLKQSGNYELVELKPATGRTHQLRVHLSHLKHPIVGDQFYDGEPADRLYLHAESLTVPLPNGKTKTFTSKLPEEFNSWLEAHRG